MILSFRGLPAVSIRPVGVVLGFVGLAWILSGCVAAAVLGTGATVGVTAAQERSVGNAVDDAGAEIAINTGLLQKDPKLFRKVGVEVVEGRALLTGSVAEPDDRVEAARVAWGASGIREVINEIQVDDSSGLLSATKDTWITTQLRAKMLGDGGVNDINYNVETVNGVIYLLGIAQNQQELEAVTNHARTISGVQKVISHVRLKDDPRRNS